MEEIIRKIDITIRRAKDVEYSCPKCQYNNKVYDVSIGKYNSDVCVECGNKVKFYVSDFI